MISVLMLTFNGLALTRQALASVLAQDAPVYPIIIDNGSTDGTLEWLRTQPVHVIPLGSNQGVSKAWNIGLRLLFDQQREPYVLVINNDVVLRPDTARTLAEDGRLFVTAVGVDSLEESLGEWTPNPRPHPDFSCYCIKRAAWMKVGEFDERFWSWCGDNDFHARLTKAGIWAGTCGIPFYHIAAATMKGASQERKIELSVLFEKDKERFKAKWGCLPGTKEYEELTKEPEVAHSASMLPLPESASASPSVGQLSHDEPLPGQ